MSDYENLPRVTGIRVVTYARLAVPIAYRLERFHRVGTFIIGPDDRCTCTRTDRCPNDRAGSDDRCTVGDLMKLSREAENRFAFQGGYDQ